MTSIAVIKQVMRFDKKKVNNICIYEVEPNMSRANTRRSNCDWTSNRRNKNTYEIATGVEALDLGLVSSMSSRRLSTSGKKVSSGK